MVLAITAGVGVLSLFHYLACSLRNTTHVHDMRVRVAALRKDQAERLQALADAADAAEQEGMKFRPPEQPLPSGQQAA